MIPRKLATTTALITTLVFTSADLTAAGFRLPNQSAFATARGNAFTATANNASAVYYNPAGLSYLDGENVELGVYSIKFSVDADTATDSFSSDDKLQFVPQGFYTNSNSDWSWGLGLYAPFGLGNDWGADTSFSSITTGAEISYLTLSPVVAKSVTPAISLSAGLTINYAEAELSQIIGLQPNDEAKFTGDDYDVGFVLAALVRAGDHHRFGATYRSETDLNLEGDTTYLGFSTSSSLKITTPALVSIGYAFQPNDEWDFEFNLEWGDWSVIDQTAIVNTPLGADLPINFGWDDGFIYQFGATRFFGDSAISFGYDYNENVQSETFYNPSVADADRHWFNVGYTQFSGKNSWSVTYQFGISDRTVSNSAPSAFTGETADADYKVNAHSLSFSYGFGI